MDFSQIPWLETALNYTIGGVSVFAILLAITRLVSWLKTNKLSDLIEEFKNSVIGKDITVSLETIAKKELAALKTEFLELQKKGAEEIAAAQKAQSAVLTDLADITLQRKSLLSKEQIDSLKAHTDAIRTHEAVPANETIKITLGAVDMTQKDKPKEKPKKIEII